MLFKRSDIITSRLFLIGLFLLLANDFYFKAVFQNTITGKLSDFAGLFVFALFWIGIFPRFARGLCLTLGIAFLFWKSPYSQPILDGWNAVGIFHLGRTVDLSDLTALLVLPLAFLHANRKILFRSQRKWAVCSIALISLFAFTATSYRTSFDDYHKNYHFPGSKAEFFNKVDNLHLNYFDHPLREEMKRSGKLELEIPSNICFDSIFASMEVSEAGDQTVVSLKELTHQCPKGRNDREQLLAEFEKEFIERIRTNTPQTKHYKEKS